MTLILLVFAFVCFVLAAFNVSARWNLIAAGLAFYMAALIFGSAGAFFRTGTTTPVTNNQASLAKSFGDQRHLKAFKIVGDPPKPASTPPGGQHWHTQSVTKPLPPPRELEQILNTVN